MSGVDLDSLE